MFTATLIAPRGALDPALVEALRNAWGGGDALWLSPDEAAEATIGITAQARPEPMMNSTKNSVPPSTSAASASALIAL